ncbi:hypothetical protein LMTR3_27645 [Bradyrhizobium sp. LMTR 3]|nr:hypothetical protein LMTR3_27645 [Bradyrhizobium sp. LMTR 3]
MLDRLFQTSAAGCRRRSKDGADPHVPTAAAINASTSIQRLSYGERKPDSDAQLIADGRQDGCWMDRLLAALCRLR